MRAFRLHRAIRHHNRVMKRYLPQVAPAVFAAVAMLSGCGGGGGGSSSPGVVPNQPGNPATPGTAAPPTPTPTPPGPSTQTLVTTPGGVLGETNQFNPNRGDASAGGQGQPVDNVTCDSTMSNNYHVHFYLGIFVNGKQVATPAGIGMKNPHAPDSRGFVNYADCFYHIHTHDASGLVHVEDPNPQNLPITATMYTLKTMFDIWGVTVNSNQFGPFSGPVRVFTTGQLYRGDSGNGTVPAKYLTFYGTDANNIPIYSYEVIFIEVGPTYPTTLPNVHFYEQH